MGSETGKRASGARPTIGEVIRAWAAAEPDAPALLAPGRATLSYHMLALRLDEMRARLAGFGLGRGDRVAVALPSNAEMVVALLGVMEVASAVPLDTAHTESELDRKLAALGIRALISGGESGAPARLAAARAGLPVLEVVPRPGEPAGTFAFAGNPTWRDMTVERATSEDIAVVLHTAGTTGRAKIVPISHRAVTSRAVRKADVLTIDSDDRCLSFAPLYHGHGLFAGVLASLAVGASVVVLPGFTPGSFYRMIEDFRPTWYTATVPGQQAILANTPRRLSSRGETGLRFIHIAGHAPLALKQALEFGFSVPAIESYDSIEAGVLAAEALRQADRRAGTVGRIASSAFVSVVDERGRRLRAGETGEIVVRGPTVFAGYDGAGEADAEQFVDGWFRTGDRGSIDDEGFLTLSGRTAEVIVRGGREIAPLEIDRALEAHPAVAMAVAFALPHPRLGTEIAAAVVLERGAAVTAWALARFVRRRLTRAKMPRRIVFVDEIPANALGKPIRDGLAAWLELADPERQAPGPWREMLDKRLRGSFDGDHGWTKR